MLNINNNINNKLRTKQSIKQNLIKIYETKKWEDLEVGNIVWLKNGEISPADLLILDTRQQYCILEEQLINGKS